MSGQFLDSSTLLRAVFLVVFMLNSFTKHQYETPCRLEGWREGGDDIIDKDF